MSPTWQSERLRKRQRACPQRPSPSRSATDGAGGFRPNRCLCEPRRKTAGQLRRDSVGNCPQVVAASLGRPVTNNLRLPMHGGEFKADGQQHLRPGPPRAMDSYCPPSSKTANCKSTLKYFRSNVPKPGKDQASAMRVSVDEEKKSSRRRPWKKISSKAHLPLARQARGPRQADA